MNDPSVQAAEAAQLQLIQTGDAQAFGEWAGQAERSLRGALRAFAAYVDTEAVLQEALLRVWQVAPRFKPDGRPNALLRFAMRATRNCALSEVRRLGPSQAVVDELSRATELEEAVAPSTPDPFLRRALADCQQKLPKQPAAALQQRLTSPGDDDAALAARVGMTLNTFLQNFTRARKLLRECLGKAGITLELELP